MALTPPTLAHHGHFRPDLPRTLIREYKLPCSPSRFFARYWSTKDCYLTFGDGMGFSKMVVGEWNVSEDGGYIQRNCSWIIPVGSFAVGGITPVNQTQRARFQDKNLLIIELTTSTPEVPYGNAFTIEQQYEIHDLGTDNLNLRTSCGIHWMTNPWGASMVSGTIESRSFEETTKSTCHLLALIEQDLKNVEQAQSEAKQLMIEKKRKKTRRVEEKGDKKERKHHHHHRRDRIENTENKEETKNVIKEEAEDAESSSFKESRTNFTLPLKDLEAESISPFKSISLPSTRTDVSRDDLSPTSNAWTQISAIIAQVLGKCLHLLKLFLASEIFQIVSLCIISIMVLLLYSRVISLENRVSVQLENDNIKKVQFLQRFVKDLSYNISGDTNLYDTHLVAWRSSNLIQSALVDWQKQIVNLMKNIRKQSDFSSTSAVDFTQDLLRKLDEHTMFMENMMPYETWAAWFFYWISVSSVIGICITVLIFYKANNKEKAD